MSKQYASIAVITLLAITPASAQQATPTTPQRPELAATLNYAVRETTAPPAARARLQSLRADL